MERLSKIPSANAVGRRLNDIFPSMQEKISPALVNGRTRRVRGFRNICFMGTDLCADLHVFPTKDQKGNVTGLRVEIENISGQCPLTKQLADSEKMVAIGKVASSLAHGVRNPLNAIKGAVVYLREKYGHESTLLEFSEIIYDEINKLDSFISSFLSTARGESKLFPINLNDILHSIFVMIKPRTEIQQIRIIHDLNPLPLIYVDHFQIEQAIFNIINNAVEAMPKGGVIKIKSSLKFEAADDYAVITISDTGGGIPDKKLRELGELKGNAESNDRGFGIFLSREVIKAHGGKLLWESVRDRGTTFKIFLPVKQRGQSD